MNVEPKSPTWIDVGRTVCVAFIDLLPFLLKLAFRLPPTAASTGTTEGLAQIQASYSHAIAHLGVKLEVLRAAQVPREGGLVFMFNQTTHLDHLVLVTAIPRPFLTLYNNAVSRVPIYGSHLRASGHFHVDRTDRLQWRTSIARAAEKVQQGCCVLVSPEGTRSHDGRLLPMKPGAFILAVASQRPIVCITVIGGHALMPRGSPVVRGGPLRVVFSDPIETVGHTQEALEPLQSEVVATFERFGRDFALRR